MNRTGRSWRLLPLTAVLAGIGLAVTGCGSAGPAPVNPPPASAHTAAERAAVMNWLLRTDRMWTNSDFVGLDQVTTGQMRTIYLSEQRQASLPSNADRQSFLLTDLSITTPCHTGPATVFVAYADTNVTDLYQSVQPVALVFERTGGAWKLATAVNRPSSGWPALCTQGTPPTTPAVLPPGSYVPALARVLNGAATGAAQTAQTASPFAVNDFLAGSGSIPAVYATSSRQDRRGGVSFTTRFATTPDPTFALPLAGGRGFWVIGALTQSNTYSAPSGVTAKDWPDGNQVATPRPAVVHHETDTFSTTYAAIDPVGPADATVALDGFFGLQLTGIAS
jgi:hypothetical protein